ncbi:MAG: PAS domain S-box protein [Desulfamplus sp.]|nr:PAS domain S-box protein [Desulfamplus sp.]
MITAIKTDSQSRIKGLEVGANTFLAKPIDEYELVSQIKVALRIKKAEDALRKERDSLERLVEERTAELKESEARFRVLFEQAGVGVAQVETFTGRFIRINQKYCDIVGYTQSEMLKLDFKTISHPDDLGKDLENMERLIAGEIREFSMEKRYYRKDGSIIWVLLTVSPLWNQGEKPENHIAVVQDITERKNSEVEREKLQAQFTQSQKMESIGRLAGGVAHDLNNMLGVIIGHTELAMDIIDHSNLVYEDLEEIHKAAERSASLTRQLLAFARKQIIAPQVINLNKIVNDMLKMLERIIGENIELKWQPQDDLWTIKIDPSQIDQILANLCVNARDAIKSVGILTIKTENIFLDQKVYSNHTEFFSGEYVLLSVNDNGSGIDKTVMENIFEPFFTTKEVGKGTGLGLSTIYGIVKQNNGIIDVKSTLGEGSTFNIYFPRYIDKNQQIQNNFLKGEESTSIGRETILLVEDEPSILTLTRMMLQKQGYTVLAAKRPGEAIDIAQKYPSRIDLLMTDVVMPEMNGRDLAKNILSIYPDIKRLFMSGYTANVIAHHGVLDAGVHFIQKPFSKQELSLKVRDALSSC